PPPPVGGFEVPPVTVGGALNQTTGQFISGQVAALIFSGGQGTGGGASVGGIETGGGVVSANQGSAPQTGISANFADSRNLGSVVGTLTGPTSIGNQRFVESFVRTGNVNTEMRVIGPDSNGRPVPAYRIGISPELASAAPASDALAVALASANPIRIESSGPIRIEGAGIEAALPAPSLQAQLAAAASIFDADAARLADALSAAFAD
ncbi:MAG: hypothetical protein NBV67_13665, partial [Tagaea sp.]|nr:hypothetical protein [Tagaea sp.]